MFAKSWIVGLVPDKLNLCALIQVGGNYLVLNFLRLIWPLFLVCSSFAAWLEFSKSEIHHSVLLAVESRRKSVVVWLPPLAKACTVWISSDLNVFRSHTARNHLDRRYNLVNTNSIVVKEEIWIKLVLILEDQRSFCLNLLILLSYIGSTTVPKVIKAFRGWRRGNNWSIFLGSRNNYATPLHDPVIVMEIDSSLWLQSLLTKFLARWVIIETEILSQSLSLRNFDLIIDRFGCSFPRTCEQDEFALRRFVSSQAFFYV